MPRVRVALFNAGLDRCVRLTSAREERMTEAADKPKDSAHIPYMVMMNGMVFGPPVRTFMSSRLLGT